MTIVARWVAATLIGACCSILLACEQPAPRCATAIGKFTAQFRLVAGSKTGDGTCDEVKGGELGVAYYPARGASSLPDKTRARLGIQAYELVGEPFDEANPNVSLGTYATERPDGEEICKVPTLNPSALRDEEADIDLRYAWSDVRVHVSADEIGTRFTARLEYTDHGCTALYDVDAIYPSVDCAEGVGEPMQDEDGYDVYAEYRPLDALCTPEVVAAAGYPGFNKDWRMVCDPDLLKCVRDNP